MLSTYEALSVVGATFGIAGFVLAGVAILVFMRVHHRGSHPHAHYHHAGAEMDDGIYNQADVPLAGKHHTETWVSVNTRSGRPTDWRPFWPLFFCIVCTTLVLIGLPLIIWLMGGDVHHFHHPGDDSSSAAASSAASSSASVI